MAFSSGNSSGSSTQPQKSGSEEDMQVLLDQRKRKRMQSNRESARRSRMRKQQHLDDLTAQVAQVRKENNQILTRINLTSQHYLNIEAENSILRAQMAELRQSLHSLNEILQYINTINGVFETDHETTALQTASADSFMTTNYPLKFMYLNQPIVASANMFNN